MARTCKNCGAALADDAVFCLSCGIALPASPVQPTVPTPESQDRPAVNPVPVSPVQSEASPGKKRKFPVKGLCISVAVLAVLVAVFMIFSIFFARPYQDAVDDYVRLFLLGDTENIEDIAPEECWDWYEEYYYLSVKQMIKNVEKYTKDKWDFYKDFVGEDLRFTYDFKTVTQYSRHQVEMMAQNLEDQYDIDADTVTNAYHLYLDVTVEGENGNMAWTNQNIYLVEIDGNWYPVTYSFDTSGDIYVQFMLRSLLY